MRFYFLLFLRHFVKFRLHDISFNILCGETSIHFSQIFFFPDFAFLKFEDLAYFRRGNKYVRCPWYIWTFAQIRKKNISTQSLWTILLRIRILKHSFVSHLKKIIIHLYRNIATFRHWGFWKDCRLKA